jgi:hypothetical protein
MHDNLVRLLYFFFNFIVDLVYMCVACVCREILIEV